MNYQDFQHIEKTLRNIAFYGGCVTATVRVCYSTKTFTASVVCDGRALHIDNSSDLNDVYEVVEKWERETLEKIKIGGPNV
jgi:hypothetical protein